ncbi:MAG: aquaporin family protein [Cyclobacteriaceae bacterium]|nr:aquaporin family protein [Cyclobacteriaceae bacterium]
MNVYLAEFFGTMILIILGDGVVAGSVLKGTKSEKDGWLTIVLGWGLAVTLAIYAVGSISGAHLNPALTIAFAVQGSFPWSDVAGYIAAQMAGAFVGAIIVWVQFLPHWKKTEDPGLKLAVFSTGPAIRNSFYNVLSEIIATSVLVIALLFIGTNEFTQGLKPIIVGMLIISIGLSLGGTTGFALNPARDLGPRIAHAILPISGKGSSDWGYAWIPIVGPIVGGLAGVYIYQIFFS